MVVFTHSASLVARRLTAGVGLLGAALLPGVAQRKSRPGMTAPCHTPWGPWVIAATPARLRRHSRRGPRRRLDCPACRLGVPGALAGVVVRTIRRAGPS